MDIEREAFEELQNPIVFERIAYIEEANLYTMKNDFRNDLFTMAKCNELNFGWKMWQAAKAQAVPEWISVKNAMPKAGSWFVAYDDFNGFVDTGKADGHEEPNNVFFSHWMPLPNTPKAQEQAND